MTRRLQRDISVVIFTAAFVQMFAQECQQLRWSVCVCVCVCGGVYVWNEMLKIIWLIPLLPSYPAVWIQQDSVCLPSHWLAIFASSLGVLLTVYGQFQFHF